MIEKLSPISVYTDGACRVHTSKKGSWAFALIEKDNLLFQDFYFENNTSSQRMELFSIIKGLDYCKINFPCREINIYTDSEYARNGIDKWCKTWIMNGWKTASGESVKNIDLWKDLNRLCDETNVRMFRVPGHNGDTWNEYVDRLTQFALEIEDPAELIRI